MPSWEDRSALTSFGPKPKRFEAQDESAIPIGPACQILSVQADPGGGILYKIPNQQPRVFQLGPEMALAPIEVIDSLRAAWMLEPGSHRLRALCIFGSGQNRVFFFGESWGLWIDDKGQRQRGQDPVTLMKHFKAPAFFEPRTYQFGCEFNITTTFREAFSEEARRSFQHGPLAHQIVLLFETPLGRFAGARVLIHDKHSAGAGWSYGIDGFPLLFPKPKSAPKPPAPTPPPPQVGFGVPYKGTRVVYIETTQPPERKAPEPEKLKLRPRPPAPGELAEFGLPESLAEPRAPRAALKPAPEPAASKAKLRPAEPEPEPAPTAEASMQAAKGHLTMPVQQMPLPDLIRLVNSKTDEAERWKAIEANLMLRRSERTYPLLSRYGDLIAERTLAWPASRLRYVFGAIPGGVLIGVMHEWNVNQILAVAEENPESDLMLDWLREREMERLMASDSGEPIGSPDAARRALGIDRNADAAMIDKACVTLLKFLAPERGDGDAKIISRRAHDVAARLMSARDYLAGKS